jgi:cobalt-zinc-cadmium efflux system protein
MATMHSHGHEHRHSLAPKNFGPMFTIATALNVGLVAIQVFYGIVAHSVALVCTENFIRID